MSNPPGVPFREPYFTPLGPYGEVLPRSTLVFLRTGSAGPQRVSNAVFTDAALTTAYPLPITADAGGRFLPMYLRPNATYRAELFSADGRKMQDVEPCTFVPNRVISSAVKTANTVKGFGVPLGDDPDLQVTITKPGTYDVDFMLGVSASGSSVGMEMAPIFTGQFAASEGLPQAGIYPRTNVNFGYAFSAPFSGYVFMRANIIPPGDIQTIPANPTTPHCVRLSFTQIALGPGTFKFRWTSATGSQSVTLWKGSALRVTQLV